MSDVTLKLRDECAMCGQSRAEVRRLREALEYCASYGLDDADIHAMGAFKRAEGTIAMMNRARAALGADAAAIKDESAQTEPKDP